MEGPQNRPSYEPDHVPAGAPDPEVRLSAVQRLVKAFHAPGEVFEDIRVKPSWLVVLLVIGLAVFAVLVVTMSHIDLAETIRQDAERRGREITEEQLEQAVEFMSKPFFRYLQPAAGFFLYPLGIALVALVFFLGLKLAGSESSYSRILSMTAHAYWPPTLVSCILGGILISRVGMITGSDAQTLVKSNLGAFLDPSSAPWVLALARSVDIFNIWIIALTVIGLTITGRVSRTVAATVAGVSWFSYLAIKIVWAAIFG
jgi:hypothetical protein